MTVFLFSLFLSLPLFAQIDYAPNTISVIGSAELEVIPNEVVLKVVLHEVNVRDVKMSMLQARSSFIALTKEAGIIDKEISIENLGGSAAFRWIGSWRSSKKAVVNEIFTYHLKFTDFTIMERFLKSIDQPYVRSLNLEKASHSEILEYRKDVKKDALKAAMEKSKYLAEVSGRKMGQVIYIDESPIQQVYSGLNTRSLSNWRGGQELESIPENKNVFGSQFKAIIIRSEIKLISELN